MTKIVNSWNDFDPLKHVIVGRADFSGGITEKSARPTMTCLSGSKSFHELTIFVMCVSLPCAL